MPVMTTIAPKDSTATGSVRTLTAKELPLLREHLMRLDRGSRHDRFNGFVDDTFIERYAERSVNDGTIILVYVEDGEVRGAAELHQPDLSPGSLPEIAFSVETTLRRKGVGSILFHKLIAQARSMGYAKLRITTGAQNDAMRALAAKFGAKLTFRHGESSGYIDLTAGVATEAAAPRKAASWFDVQGAMVDYSRAYWRLAFKPTGR